MRRARRGARVVCIGEERGRVKALVTGASGFIGSHLAARLVRDGVQVVVQVRATSRQDALRGLDVERRFADLCAHRDFAALVEGVDVVFHVAGVARARDAETYRRVNFEGTRGLFEAARAAGVRRFVFVSSLAAAGPDRSPGLRNESEAPRPIHPYGESKLAAERFLLAAGAPPAVIVRPPGVYGPRDTSFLPLFRTACRWGIVPILGGERKRLTLIHVADLVEALRLAGSAACAEGQVYYVGSGTHTWGEVGRALAAALGRPLRPLPVPSVLARLAGEFGELKWTLTGRPQVISRRKVRDMLQPGWTCSWSRAERELGYRPRISLEKGLHETGQWYVEHGWI